MSEHQDTSVPKGRYKKSFPRAWIVSTQLGQEASDEDTTEGNSGSTTSLEPPSTTTLPAPSPVSSSSTNQSAVNGNNTRTEGSTPTRAKAQEAEPKSSHSSDALSPELKSGFRSKFKSIFHSRSASRSQVSSGQPSSSPSPKITTGNMDVCSNEPTPTPKASAHTPEHGSTIKQFGWPESAASPATGARPPSTTVQQSPSPTSGLKYQPKQLLPETSHVASNAAPFKPLPPAEFHAALNAAPSTVPARRGPPPAPSASSNNPSPSYNAVAQSDGGNSGSAHPISAASGYSTSTTSDLADVPSRLPYQSPGYSLAYSYHSPGHTR